MCGSSQAATTWPAAPSFAISAMPRYGGCCNLLVMCGGCKPVSALGCSAEGLKPNREEARWRQGARRLGVYRTSECEKRWEKTCVTCSPLRSSDPCSVSVPGGIPVVGRLAIMVAVTPACEKFRSVHSQSADGGHDDRLGASLGRPARGNRDIAFPELQCNVGVLSGGDRVISSFLNKCCSWPGRCWCPTFCRSSHVTVAIREFVY